MNISDSILNYISTQLTANDRSVGMDTKLAQDGYLDSTAMMELILWVGDTFNLTLQNEDLTPENFGTPRNIVEFVQSSLSTQGEGGEHVGAEAVSPGPLESN
jgi:acyl carrier protein